MCNQIPCVQDMNGRSSQGVHFLQGSFSISFQGSPLSWCYDDTNVPASTEYLCSHCFLQNLVSNTKSSDFLSPYHEILSGDSHQGATSQPSSVLIFIKHRNHNLQAVAAHPSLYPNTSVNISITAMIAFIDSIFVCIVSFMRP